LFSRRNLLGAQAFFRPMGATVPPLTALSLADTSTRLPATTPMPTMEPPPMTDFLPSSSCMPSPARVLSSRKALPRSSRRATRSRGKRELAASNLSRLDALDSAALRFYEDKGLLAPRRVNGARVYTRRDRARLALIIRAKNIGSSLADIKRYLDLYGDQGEGRSQQLDYVIARTDAAIAELEQKRAEIEKTLAELRVINATCRGHLEARRATAGKRLEDGVN
jgi:DNA-binding transcriptional MerR regulator